MKTDAALGGFARLGDTGSRSVARIVATRYIVVSRSGLLPIYDPIVEGGGRKAVADGSRRSATLALL
jgi:hypothetical protein